MLPNEKMFTALSSFQSPYSLAGCPGKAVVRPQGYDVGSA